MSKYFSQENDPDQIQSINLRDGIQRGKNEACSYLFLKKSTKKKKRQVWTKWEFSEHKVGPGRFVFGVGVCRG